MKKLYYFLFVLFLASWLIVPAFAQSEPYVIYNDWILGEGWVNAWAWGIYNDGVNQLAGVNCFGIDIPASAQFQGITDSLADKPINFSDYGYFIIWVYGSNNLEQFQLRLMTDAANFYFTTITNDWIGWNYFIYNNVPAIFAANGSPDIENINYISIVQGSNNANPYSLKIDYTCLSDSADPFSYEPGDIYADDSVNILWFYISIGWLLISLVIGLKYWRFFGLFGGLIGAVMCLMFLTNGYFVVNSFYDETAGTVINVYSSIGLLYWVPLLLVIINLISPMLKK